MSKKIIVPILIIVAIVVVFAIVMRMTSQPVTEPDVAKEGTNVKEPLVKPEKEEVKYIDVTPAEAQKLIKDNPDLLIVDVSPRYAEGHILNSVNYYVGNGSLDQAIPKFDKDRIYLVYCHVDSASIAGAEKLIEAGIEKVYRLSGNYVGWTGAGYPVIADISQTDVVLKTDLVDVSEGDGAGTGFVVRDDNGLRHLVRASIQTPEGENFYEGWLVKLEPKLEFFSTGRMTQTPEGNWLLEYVSSEKSEGYDQIVITLETTADETPESHILEGIAK